MSAASYETNDAGSAGPYEPEGIPMSNEVTYIDEFSEVDWVEIDCAEYERIMRHVGVRKEYGADADPSEREKLSVHIGYTDPEGHRRSKTVWGNDTHGLILWWSGYMGRYEEDGSRGPAECKEYVARHALAVVA